MDVRALALEALREHGNAVLTLSIPQWEKHYAQHSRAAWSEIIVPLMERARHSELVRPQVTMKNRHQIPAHLGLDVTSRSELLEQWLAAIADEGVWDCYLLMSADAEFVLQSRIVPMTTGVGFFQPMEKRFSREMRKAIGACLSKADYALAFGPPPFRSAYMFAAPD